MNKRYLFLRHLFFWLFLILFVIIAPISVFYSLGHKFDAKTKKFIRAGAISIKTSPSGAEIYLDGILLKVGSSHIIEGLVPKRYSLIVQKRGFYPYSVFVQVKAAKIEKLDIVLVPNVDITGGIKSGLKIYNFFIIKPMIAQQIVAFTDTGIYFLNDDLKIKQEISTRPMDRGLAGSLKGLKENNNRLMFWNSKAVWLMDISSGQVEKNLQPAVIYRADGIIRDASFGLKDRYLIIWDGLKIVALDTENPDIRFNIFTLQSADAKVFYDSPSDILYINDGTSGEGKVLFFKSDLTKVIYEQKQG